MGEAAGAVIGQRHRTSIGDAGTVVIADIIVVIAQRRTDGAALADAEAVAKSVALIRLRRLAEATGGVADSAGIGDRRGVAIADSIAAIAQHRTDGAALADAEAVAERVALIRLRRLGEAAGAVIGQRHRTSIGDSGTVDVGDGIAVIAQRRTDGAALVDFEAVAESVALIRLRRLGEAAGAVIGQRHRTSIGDSGTVDVGDGIAVIAQRRTDGAALVDFEAVAESVALIRLRRLGEAAGAVIGQRHRTSIGDAGTVVIADIIVVIAQRRTDGAALADAEAVAKSVALIRLRRLAEATGGVADSAGIGDRRGVAIADSIAAIAQRRTDGAALADAEAVAERVALIRLRRLGEAAGAVTGQRHRTSIGDGGTVGGVDGIVAIAQRRGDGAALGDAKAVAERGALTHLRRLGEASAGERPCIGLRAVSRNRPGMRVVRQCHIEVPRIGEALSVVKRDGLKDSDYLREVVSTRNRPNSG